MPSCFPANAPAHLPKLDDNPVKLMPLVFQRTGGESPVSSGCFRFLPCLPPLLAFLRGINPASSKASSTEEIQQASTYGFRGEALYSLGLTSLLEIQSRCPGKESHAKVGGFTAVRF